MKVWKIKLVNQQGKQVKKVTWLQALLRYISACLGLGILFVLFNKNRASLQDLVSGTIIVQTKQ